MTCEGSITDPFRTLVARKACEARSIFSLTLDLSPGFILCKEQVKKMRDGELLIGEAASEAGVSIDTLRYYEKLSLLGHLSRSSGGFRIFNSEAIDRVTFIKQAQELGFSLAEIRQLVTSSSNDECGRVHDLLQSKVAQLDERMNSMRRFRHLLVRQLSACERELKAHGKSAHCPVVSISRHARQIKLKKDLR
jgi:MerR family transcriptional regulator, copper efflux regulator